MSTVVSILEQVAVLISVLAVASTGICAIAWFGHWALRNSSAGSSRLRVACGNLFDTRFVRRRCHRTRRASWMVAESHRAK